LTCAHCFHHQIIASQFNDVRKKHDRFGAEISYLNNKCLAKNHLERPPATEILRQFQSFKVAHPDHDHSRPTNESHTEAQLPVYHPFPTNVSPKVVLRFFLLFLLVLVVWLAGFCQLGNWHGRMPGKMAESKGSWQDLAE
jgi:hypothetical protein